MSKRVMPPQKRGESKQDFATPRDFLSAVETRFGFERWVARGVEYARSLPPK